MQKMEVVVTGLDKATAGVNSIGEQATDSDALFKSIYHIVLEGEKSTWKRNGGGGKKKWAALATRTVKRKQALGQDNGILRRSGALERSLTTSGGTGQIKKFGEHELEFGSALYYAIFHQVGKNPREVVGIAAGPKKKIKAEILDYLTARVGE